MPNYIIINYCQCKHMPINRRKSQEDIITMNSSAVISDVMWIKEMKKK